MKPSSLLRFRSLRDERFIGKIRDITRELDLVALHDTFRDPTLAKLRFGLSGQLFANGFEGVRVVLNADLRGGIVVVLRPNRPDADEIYFETLPNSNRVWSEFGAPSQWRYRPAGAGSN